MSGDRRNDEGQLGGCRPDPANALTYNCSRASIDVNPSPKAALTSWCNRCQLIGGAEKILAIDLVDQLAIAQHR